MTTLDESRGRGPRGLRSKGGDGTLERARKRNPADRNRFGRGARGVIGPAELWLIFPERADPSVPILRAPSRGRDGMIDGDSCAAARRHESSRKVPR